MYLRRLRVQKRTVDGALDDCPLRWMDSFSMRSFTNDAIFDDTLPVADGWMEAGLLVPLERLQAAMQDWFLRKGYLRPGEFLELAGMQTAGAGHAPTTAAQEQRV